MTRILRKALAGSTIGVICLHSLAIEAEILTYRAELKGTHEVPPNQSKGAGSATITFDTIEKKLSWNGSHTGLSGPVIAAHFHGPADLGKNAGIAIHLWGNQLPSQFEGSAMLNEKQAAELMAGRWYLNLHTAAFPAGEIRGQVAK